MTKKTKYIILALTLLLSFALGRYSVPISTVKETTKTDNTKIDDSSDIHKVITIIEKPNGEKVTTITEDKKTKTITDSSKIDTTKEIIVNTKQLTVVSALIGTQIRELDKPIYGLHVSRQFAGPINVGVYGLTNGIVGVSLGLSF